MDGTRNVRPRSVWDDWQVCGGYANCQFIGSNEWYWIQSTTKKKSQQEHGLMSMIILPNNQVLLAGRRHWIHLYIFLARIMVAASLNWLRGGDDTPSTKGMRMPILRDITSCLTIFNASSPIYVATSFQFSFRRSWSLSWCSLASRQHSAVVVEALLLRRNFKIQCSSEHWVSSIS